MNWRSNLKRLFAMLLVVSMVIGIMPAGLIANAAEGETIYVLAGGDFQEAGDHANSAANVTNILAQVSQKYDTMDGFLFIGDYDCETHNSATETANGITALMGAVQGSYSNLNDANSVLVQGNHDYMDSRIDATGGHEFDGYAAYVLNEDDYPNGGGSQSGIQTLANNLKTWLNNKIGEGYSAPIFIVSHLPLAYTPRTVTQGDAKYAKYIFDVLNDAGKNGLNIIFLHGHDHAYGPDNYMGGEAIYLPVGDKICIAEAGSTSSWTEETLNFTYMNAGYTGYYSDAYTYVTTAGTDKLTMTVFAITDNQVTVERYSEDGLYNLKSAGYDGSYSNTSVDNVSLGLPKYSAVYASPQTIALVDNGAADMGTIGEWVGIEAEVTDDVTTSGNGWITITEPVPGTDAVPGTTTYKYVLDTDGVNTDTKYLIVNTSSNGNAYVLTNNNGTVERTQVTISNGEIIVDDETNINWIFSGSTSGTIVNQNRYVYPNNGSLSFQTSGSNMTISNEDNGEYLIYRTDNYSRKYYVRYNNGWTGTRVNSYSSTTYSVYLFAYDSTITTPGTEATPGTPGLYGMVDGELTYNVAAGTSAEDALAAVKAGIDIRYHYGDANAAQTFPDDGEGMTWVLDPNYDPNVPGDYAVTISFNGTVLGTAEVVVPASTTYYAAEGNGLYLVDMNTTEANAMAAVKAGVTVYSATDASGSNKTAISDDDVTWNWVDKYNGADSGPYTVEILKDGTSLGTVEVKVNIQYETGIESDWTYIGETEATGGSYTYTLDTDGIDYGEENKYIIVDDNEAIVLNANSSSNGTAHSITISGNTATLDTRDYEYHMIRSTYNNTRYELITKGDGSQYLYQESSGVRYGTRSSVKFQVNHHGSGVYDIHDIDGTNWYIIYNGGWTVTETTSARVRLYKYTGTTGGTPGGPIYALIEGDTVYTVTQGSSATKALAAVKAGITGYTATAEDGTGKTALSDSDLTWKWMNTFNGNSTGSYWVEISYQGKVLGTVEVKVEPGTVNNYPEYPDEGAVKVSKTATGIDFQSSGIAQVEVSASGVPIKKGADVIVMLDTSSSMAYCLNCYDTRHSTYVCDQGGQTRAQALEETLADLIVQFKTPGADGQIMDIDVAIADFNGFYGDNHSESGTPYDRDAADMMSDDISYTANSAAQVYTNSTGALDATAFVDAEDLETTYDLSYASGTNYDYAFDAIYQMATAKQAANSEDRDLYVIFMSDGAAMQWNYYHSQGGSNLWENWITGKWSANQLTTTNLNCTTHAYYYDEVDHNGDGMLNEHRMANAIKGDPSEQYEVIRKVDTLGTPTGEANMYMVPGLGAKLFAIAFDPRTDSQVEAQHMVDSIKTLASEQTGTTKYFYNVSSADELASAFTAIGSEIAYAAYNARYVDQMGDDYNLQMAVSNYTVVDGTTTTDKTITPKIEIISYDIYTRQDYLNGTITEDKIGDRKGTYTILETVTFNANGTEAYSDQIGGGTTNILADGTQAGYVKGVIYAKTFLYNTTPTEVAVDGISIPTGTKADGTTTGSTNLLPSETFYWKMGTVQTSEMAMRYYVYLEGSMEGTKEGGSYPTNEYAKLYYDNYLNNPCHKDTVSPVMAWKEANVSYAFYLVDENGNIIVNQTTGQTGSFANKIAVTNPVVYETVLLNNDEEVSSIDIASLGVLPEGYTLYDYDGTNGATYTVSINSNTTGSWEITSVKDVATTYVMQYDPKNASAYSNDLTHNTVGDDYTHTVVWFAVLWKVQALPDAVVIDYGLPVDISVLTNDMFGENGKLAGVGAYSDSLNLDGHDTTLASGFGKEYKADVSADDLLAYGDTKIDAATGKVRYTPNTTEMNGYEKFAYAVNYTGNENAGYYYDTVTVIPATTIYFEDNFVELDTLTWQQKENGEAWEGEWAVDENADSVWSQKGTTVDGTQDEDRPGKYSLTDANNIYGSDGTYKEMSTYSMDSAMKATVDYDHAGQASFTFYGTGFDVISMTNSTTGTIYVYVYKVNADGTRGDRVKSNVVDTYFGYAQAECHVIYTWKDTDLSVDTNDVDWVKSDVLHKTTECTDACKALIVEKLPESGTVGQEVHMNTNAWVVSTSEQSMWQVPVMKVEKLEYGRYEAVIQAIYEPAFDHVDGSEKVSYDFYLDAIRIYDPANNGAADGSTDTTIEDAYKADGEGWPSYIELRNKIIAASSFDNVANDALTTDMEGLVFIDGDASVGDAQISDYTSYGPNNEVYLAPGQRVAFLLDVPANIANVHIGIKSADGKTATYTITNIAKATNSETGVTAGDYYGAKTSTVNTTTDMYYDLTGWKNDIIVISNTGDKYNTTGILSITNIKSTYTSDPNGAVTTGDTGVQATSEVQTYGVMTAAEEEEATANLTSVYMTPAAATLTLRSLNAPVEEETPEETVPETTVPEETEPETTVPEETEPETTVPEETVPETTVPETTVPEETEPEEDSGSTGSEVVDQIIDLIGKLFGWLFG